MQRLALVFRFGNPHAEHIPVNDSPYAEMVFEMAGTVTNPA